MRRVAGYDRVSAIYYTKPFYLKYESWFNFSIHCCMGTAMIEIAVGQCLIALQAAIRSGMDTSEAKELRAQFVAQANEGRVPLEVYNELARTIFRRMGRPDLGLEFGSNIRLVLPYFIGDFSPVTHTLKDAIQNILINSQMRCSHNHNASLHVWFEDAILRSPTHLGDDDLQAFFEDLFVSCWLHFFKEAGIRQFDGFQVFMKQPRQSWHGQLEEAFDARFHWNHTETRIQFPARLLHQEFSVDRFNLESLPQKLERAVLEKTMGSSEYVDRVVRHMLQAILHEKVASPNAADMARLMHTSASTLRRRLADAGWSYQKLLDHVRALLASALLESRLMSTKEVAHYLGFTDTGNFRRAFKTWTGYSPAEYVRTRQAA